MAQPFNISRLITRLIVLAGGCAIDQVVRRLHRPGVRATTVEQVASNALHPFRELLDSAAQPADLPATDLHLLGQTATDIATTDDQN
ncbi:hypothetical protein D3C72_2178830 [compost metagenome]